MKQRNINEDSIKEFKIGYAPVENNLYNYLAGQGYTSNCIEEVKLFAKSKDNNIQERFCDRIIFPKLDVDGRIVSFGARAINERIPKFLASPESRIYEKPLRKKVSVRGIFLPVPAARAAKQKSQTKRLRVELSIGSRN